MADSDKDKLCTEDKRSGLRDEYLFIFICWKYRTGVASTATPVTFRIRNNCVLQSFISLPASSAG